MSYVNSHSRNWWLVGDIGGTNARFALYDGTDAELGEGRLFSRETLAASEFAKFSDAVESFLRRAGVDAENLRGASLAVACPLGDEEIHFTNSPWHFSPSDLQQVLRLQHLTFVNDFEALALSVPRMRAESLRSLRAGRMAVQSPKLILGPGTGLGVAGVFPVVSDGVSTWRAVPGEGGHVAFAPIDDFEADLLRHLRARHTRVSVERVVCGDGLVSLHEFLATRAGSSASTLTAATIAKGASEGDAVCRDAVTRFLAILGSFAGDCALLFAARGGVYFGGGVLPKIAPMVADSPLIDRFNAKGRMSSWISQIPLSMIMDDAAALRGAAIAAVQY